MPSIFTFCIALVRSGVCSNVVNYPKNMLIGEVSKQTGLSKDTIRYYEKSGLLKREQKARRRNHYKEYSELDLKILFFIQLTKEYGFTLNEIKDFLSEIEKKKNEAF